MSEHVKAPWTDEQVENLLCFQDTENLHPFTADERWPNGWARRLIPTRDGWVLRVGGPVVQDWAWDFMLDGSLLMSIGKMQTYFESPEGKDLLNRIVGVVEEKNQ
jgi:hypothetical protein